MATLANKLPESDSSTLMTNVWVFQLDWSIYTSPWLKVACWVFLQKKYKFMDKKSNQNKTKDAKSLRKEAHEYKTR